MTKSIEDLLSYDPTTGDIRWKEAPNRFATRSRVGEWAGCVNGQGYRLVTVGQKIYNAHRIAWYLHYGEWPSQSIDHINTIKSDNRIENLRLANNSENHANVKRPSTNTSGRKGVTWNKKLGKWQAQIKINGKNKYLGLFEDVDDAHGAYVMAANENFKQFARSA